jgi:hypothetical protein
MKQIHFIISLLLQIVLFSSCGKSQIECIEKDIYENINHTFKLDSVSQHWFAYYGYNYIELRSPEGQIFKTYFSRASYLEFAYLADHDSVDYLGCHFRTVYGAKGEFKYVYTWKNTSGMPFDIMLEIRKNMHGQFTRNTDIKTMEAASDVISLSAVNGARGTCELLVKDLKKYPKSSKIFYDSTYNNVITVKGNNYDLAEMYLQENGGIIGFKFVNGNPWMISYRL